MQYAVRHNNCAYCFYFVVLCWDWVTTMCAHILFNYVIATTAFVDSPRAVGAIM